MGAAKTMEELMQGIDSFVKDIDWDNGESKGVIYFAHNNGDSMCNAHGNCGAVISAIANMMICDKDIREVICSAYMAYVDYSAKNVAKVYGPLIKKMDEVMKEHFSSKPSVLAPCLVSAKFKRRN